MTRDRLIKAKELAWDRFNLCASVFYGNKPPSEAHCVEMMAHAAIIQTICAELGEPLPILPCVFEAAGIEMAIEHLRSIQQAEPETMQAVEAALIAIEQARGKGGAS